MPDFQAGQVHAPRGHVAPLNLVVYLSDSGQHVSAASLPYVTKSDEGYRDTNWVIHIVYMSFRCS